MRVEVVAYRDGQAQQYLDLDQLGRTSTLPERFPIRHIDTEVYPNALIGAVTLHSRRPERVQLETLREYGLMSERTMSGLARVIKRLQTTQWEIVPEWRTIEIPLSVSADATWLAERYPDLAPKFVTFQARLRAPRSSRWVRYEVKYLYLPWGISDAQSSV